MSRIFKRPKVMLRMGTPQARMVKYARTIKTEDDLKRIISQVPKATALGFLEVAKDYLPFELDLSNLDKSGAGAQ